MEHCKEEKSNNKDITTKHLYMVKDVAIIRERWKQKIAF